MMFKQIASPLMSELDKFDNEFSPCDFILGCTLPFWKEVAALVTCDLVTSVVEGLSDLGYIKKPAAVSTMIIGQNFCSCYWCQLFSNRKWGFLSFLPVIFQKCFSCIMNVFVSILLDLEVCYLRDKLLDSSHFPLRQSSLCKFWM